MLYIADLNTILLQPPRTASTSLREALCNRHPGTRALHRHMERDGIPPEAAQAHVACVIRHPVERLRSLWRYMRAVREDLYEDPAWKARVRRLNADADRPFEDWLIKSQDIFHNDPSVQLPPDHYYAIRHEIPAVEKSQWWWARPDLGPVDILRMEDMDALERRFDICLPHHNATSDSGENESLSPLALMHILHHHSWDAAHYPDLAAKLYGAQAA